jgi:type IV pilus assembly protein PilY1
MSTADLNASVNSVVSSYNDGDGLIDTTPSATCPKFAGSRNLDDLSWLAKNRSIRDFTETPAATDPEINSKTITTYAVFNGVSSTDPNECNPEKLLMETAENGCGTSSGCYQRAENPAKLRTALEKAFLQISGRAASGTAASVLASGEGSGANLIQAIFYPSRTFGTTQITWTGTLQNFWYYIDPLLNNSSIREDSNTPGTLDLRNDYIVHFFFDTDKQTKVKLFADADGNGLADNTIPVATKYVDETLDPTNKVKYIWEAGKKLWETPAASRTMYTFDGTSRITLPDTIASGSTLIDLMQVANFNEATAIARYVKGTDLKVCSINKNICTTIADCTAAGETCDAYRSRTVTIDGTTHVWKLGDIISSTPKLSSWIPVGTYQTVYKDSTYGPVGEIPNYSDPADTTYFITRSEYKNRGAVFVGANDGMLHAFKLGTVSLSDDKYVKAQVSGTDIGSELWTYIPKHALPYLKYTADPGYCHIYSVDLVPSIFDVSIGGFPTVTKTADSWKTVLIGGMRYGGACADTATSYQVQTPASGKGYSSYFALDITDPINPQILWEFSNESIAALYPGDLVAGGIGGLGFTTTGPALIRTGEKDKNGRWFVVFASGPTGPIDTTTHQFTGYSDQNLKFYIIDLKNGPTAGNIWRVNTGIQNAFAGSLQGSPIDLDQNNSSASGYYKDDAMYFGYTYAEENPLTVNTKWTKGGVIRLVTNEDPDPGNWVWSKVIEDIGPVTASVSKLQNYKAGNEALWLFFGSGRYYFKVADVIDDANSRRSLYGIKDPCFITDPTSAYYKKIDPTCSSTISGDSGIDDATSAGLSSPGNWKINLDMCTNASGTLVDCADSSVLYRAERLVTAPVSSPIGAVFFTTVKPSADVCEFGGNSYLWGVKYSTGGSIPRGLLKGTALIQVSTGSIEEKELKSVFVEKVDSSTGEGRRTVGMAGQTNEGGALIPVPPKPTNKILHIRER